MAVSTIRKPSWKEPLTIVNFVLSLTALGARSWRIAPIPRSATTKEASRGQGGSAGRQARPYRPGPSWRPSAVYFWVRLIVSVMARTDCGLSCQRLSSRVQAWNEVTPDSWTA